LPCKDTSIRAAAYGGSGRETEYRIEGNAGLVLTVQAPGRSGSPTKTWRYYYSRVKDGRQVKRKFRIGTYPEIGLADARRRAADFSATVERGGDPVIEERDQRLKHQRNLLTLSDLIADYLGDQSQSGVSSVGEIKRALDRDVVPTLGHLHPAVITDLQIEEVIDAVAQRGKPAMARHLLTYVRGLYNHALHGSPRLRKKYGLTRNPAEHVGRGRRGNPGKYGRQGVDDRHLNDAEIPAFWQALEERAADPRTKTALKLLLLTGQRTKEVVRANISEIRLTGAEPTWLIPGARTKNKLTHLVPLPALAARLFAEAIGGRERGPVFPSDDTKDGILGEYTLRQAVTRLFETGRLKGEPFTPKDLRTTVKTGMAALRIPREIRDAVQNHKPQGIGDRAYNFHDYATEKREALQSWSEHIAMLIERD
jgi:integrase